MEWQTNISKEKALEMLITMSEDVAEVRFVIVATKFDDCHNWVHAFVQYAKKVAWRPGRWLLGKTAGTYKPSRTWKKVRALLEPCNWVAQGLDVKKALQRKKSRNIASHYS